MIFFADREENQQIISLCAVSLGWLSSFSVDCLSPFCATKEPSYFKDFVILYYTNMLWCKLQSIHCERLADLMSQDKWCLCIPVRVYWCFKKKLGFCNFIT